MERSDAVVDEGGAASERNREARELSCVASFLRDARAGAALRHPEGAGAVGHSDVSETMIYTHVLERGPGAVRSPLERIMGGEKGV